MKKARVIYLLIITHIFITSPQILIAQNKIITENKNTLNIYTLENGLTVFLQKDLSTALVNTKLAVRAGFSSQEPNTTGFCKLYSKLFIFGAQQDNDYKNRITVSCNADDATFDCRTTYSELPSFFDYLAKCATEPQFTNNQIKKEYTKLKEEVINYSSELTGFINSAIDSQIFSAAPWKQDSGIYPALFCEKQTEELRTILCRFGKKYYTPRNSALFISGNIDVLETLELVKRAFKNWDGDNAPNNFHIPKTDNSNKLFVLTDSSFSKDFSQIIVQYTNMNRCQTELVSYCTKTNSSMLKPLIDKPELAIRDLDYIAVDSAGKNGMSRLIVQALMEKPFSFVNDNYQESDICIAQQAKQFIELLKKSLNIQRNTFITAQNYLLSVYEAKTENVEGHMNLLADFWAEKNTIDTTSFFDFYEQYLNTVYDIQNQSENEIYKAVMNETPFVFLLVNTNTYLDQKKEFDKQGYIQITKDTSFWYKNELLKKSTLDVISDDEKNQEFDFSLINSAGSFYSDNFNQFSSFTLENKIPVITKVNTGSGMTTISIAIEGGELSSPIDEKFLRTVMINAFSENIQKNIDNARNTNTINGIVDIKAWTEETRSFITINCTKEETGQVLKSASDAILYGEIKPITADSIVSAEKSRWLVTSSDISYQMTCNALSTIYSDTLYEKLFDSESSILTNTTVSSIAKAYTELLDASLYSLVITGDFNIDSIKLYTEESFGILRQQKERETRELINPSISGLTQFVRLRHLYTTNIDSEHAGQRPTILIPTTEFSDPVQFWFMSPQQERERILFNTILYALGEKINNLYGKSICNIKEADAIINTGCIQGSSITHTDKFLKIYSTAFKELTDELENGNELQINNLKNKWILKNMDETSTNEQTANLIQKGLINHNPKQYLENFLTIADASKNDFVNILKYFSSTPKIKFYSADSKK